MIFLRAVIKLICVSHKPVAMALTFLYAIETEGEQLTFKFESPTRKTLEFMVTFLTAPHVQPFTMVRQADRWKLPEQVPTEIKALEAELLEAAGKFQR